jgi:hypothetical protein
MLKRLKKTVVANSNDFAVLMEAVIARSPESGAHCTKSAGSTGAA